MMSRTGRTTSTQTFAFTASSPNGRANVFYSHFDDYFYLINDTGDGLAGGAIGGPNVPGSPPRSATANAR